MEIFFFCFPPNASFYLSGMVKIEDLPSKKNFPKKVGNPHRKGPENTVLRLFRGPRPSTSVEAEKHLPRPLIHRHQEHCLCFPSCWLAHHLLSCLSFGPEICRDLVVSLHCKSWFAILSPKQDILTEETFGVDHYATMSKWLDQNVKKNKTFLMTRWSEFWTFLNLSFPVSSPFLELCFTPEFYPRTLPLGQLSNPVKSPKSVGSGRRGHAVNLALPEGVGRVGN